MVPGISPSLRPELDISVAEGRTVGCWPFVDGQPLRVIVHLLPDDDERGTETETRKVMKAMMRVAPQEKERES